MKKVFSLFFINFLILSICAVFAQEKPIAKIEGANDMMEEEPVMFKFEPDFTTKNETKKASIANTRKIIDSLQISERKRLKLIKDLYKNGVSKRLKKALLAASKLEEIPK